MPQSNVPLCKLDLYRQLNLPLPDSSQAPSQKREHGSVRCKRAMGGDEGPICRRDILKQMGLQIPGDERRKEDMEMVIASMEKEVGAIQVELDMVQAERRQLEMQKKLIHCAAPVIASTSSKRDSLVSLPSKFPQLKMEEVDKSIQVSKPKLIKKTYEGEEEEEFEDLEEEYDKLLQDYNSKIEESAMLRVEVDTERRQSIASTRKSEQAEARVEDLEARLRAFEDESIQATGNKDRLIELTQQLAMAERMFEKSVDELEDLQRRVFNQTRENDEFRRKYLDAEQLAEEQRHKIEMLESDKINLKEEVNVELHKIKSQFQTKLEEMTLLPDLINKTNEKLKETEEIKTIADKNCVIMALNLDQAKVEKEALEKQLDEINRNRSETEAEKSSMQSFLTDGERKMEETKAENKNLKFMIARLEEVAVINGRRYEEATQEGMGLKEQLETLRQQSARQVSKTKEKFNKTRHTLLDQVACLEKQLATTRALQKTSFRDRDEIRQRMQGQITQLNENFDEAQQRIRAIQSHVNYLKTSYTNSSG